MIATTRVLLENVRQEAIEAAKDGMSMEGIAHACRVSRVTLWRWRQENPDFDADLLAALSEFERGLLKDFKMYLGDEKAQASAGHAKAMLAQRFPQRHGVDPRIRLDTRAATL